jgi:hypothetical protein
LRSRTYETVLQGPSWLRWNSIKHRKDAAKCASLLLGGKRSCRGKKYGPNCCIKGLLTNEANEKLEDFVTEGGYPRFNPTEQQRGGLIAEGAQKGREEPGPQIEVEGEGGIANEFEVQDGGLAEPEAHAAGGGNGEADPLG